LFTRFISLRREKLRLPSRCTCPTAKISDCFQ
jgi:hypothetical protein